MSHITPLAPDSPKGIEVAARLTAVLGRIEYAIAEREAVAAAMSSADLPAAPPAGARVTEERRPQQGRTGAGALT